MKELFDSDAGIKFATDVMNGKTQGMDEYNKSLQKNTQKICDVLKKYEKYSQFFFVRRG